MTNKSSAVQAKRPPSPALDRNRSSSTAMAVMARKLRFATSRRSPIYSRIGLRPRMADRIFRVVAVLLALALFVAPNAAAVAYYAFLASDQYQSETRFTVRTSAPILKPDKLADISGLPSTEIMQNSLIVTNFIDSRTMLAVLEKEADFTKAYSNPDTDLVARLDPNSTIEEKLDYWEDAVSSEIDPQSGIITVDVRAFSAQEAKKIVDVIVAHSERMINELNDRIWTDITASARQQVEKATADLNDARTNLQRGQNQAGILTVEGSSDTLSALLLKVQEERIELQGRYDTNARVIDKGAPQMRVLKRQIDSKEKQVQRVKAQIAGQSDEGDTLADTSVRFSELNFRTNIASQQLQTSIGAYEQLQYSSQQQLMYLDPFLTPTLPQSAEYPRRWLWIGVTLLASLVATAIALGLLKIVRTRFD